MYIFWFANQFLIVTRSTRSKNLLQHFQQKSTSSLPANCSQSACAQVLSFSGPWVHKESGNGLSFTWIMQSRILYKNSITYYQVRSKAHFSFVSCLARKKTSVNKSQKQKQKQKIQTTKRETKNAQTKRGPIHNCITIITVIAEYRSG